MTVKGEEYVACTLSVQETRLVGRYVTALTTFTLKSAEDTDLL